MKIEPKRPEEELILYDEAIERTGGLGAYQIFILFVSGVLCNYGSQMVFAFGYLTNPSRLLCRTYEDELWSEWAVCSQEFICSNLSPQIEYKADTTDPKFVDGVFTHMDLTCMPSDKVANMAALYFIGWAFGSFIIWVPDAIGRVKMYKTIIIPSAIVLFNVYMFSNSYFIKCCVYFLMGLTKMKSNLTVLTSLEHLPKKYQGLSTSFIFALEGLTIGMMAFYF